MIQTPVILVAAAGLMLAGAGANEMTHGAVAEGMGIGHQHMADYGGYHCADPDDADWQTHQQHIHSDGDMTDHCSDDHMGLQGHHGGMR